MKFNKICQLFFAIILSCLEAISQPGRIHPLQQELLKHGNDSSKMIILDSLQLNYLFFSDKPDSSFFYINQLVSYAFTQPEKKALILAYSRMGFYYINIAHYKSALDITLQGIKLSEETGITDYLSSLYNNIAWVYLNFNDYHSALAAVLSGKANLPGDRDRFLDEPLHLAGLAGNIYLEMNKPDSAFYYFSQTASLASRSKEMAAKDISGWYWGMFMLQTKNYPKADSFFEVGIHSCEQNHDFLLNAFHLFSAQSLVEQRKFHEAIRQASIGMALSRGVQDKSSEANGASLLNACYDQLGNRDSAYYFLKVSDSLNAIVLTNANAYDIQQINFRQQLNKQEEEQARTVRDEKNRNRTIAYVFITALIFLIVILMVQLRNNIHRKNANRLLQEQKQQVENALASLKSAQSQLIQSAKMASLGELTAGIAHEIQNPLNFINNFSELNKELLVEMKEEIKKGNIDEVSALADEVIGNEDKIDHHGKRADAIVKGMLQHSRPGTGAKEPTDINALANEYLRLAYHGVKAKDNSVNVTLNTDFDTSIGKVNINTQDIGRVLLNLYNNAFYAVSEKKKASASSALPPYEPTVSVSTEKINDKIIIAVKDNGNGIPQKVVDKIFQPFFTTKPTGQGIGLGLSLSYDIIKAYGGEIKVETNEGEGSEFIIGLPLG